MAAIEEEDLELILNARPTVWEKLNGKRIFITGSTGFFGIWILSAFYHAFKKGKFIGTVSALSRNPNAFLARHPEFSEAPFLTFHKGDVGKEEFPDQNFDFIIHAATEASVKMNMEEPLQMFDIAAGGTRKVLDFAVRSGAKRFLLTSSGAVYGKQPSDITHLPENYSGAPDVLLGNAAYGEGKRVAEMFCNFYGKQKGIETVIARCYAFSGPYLPIDTHFAIGNFVRDYLGGGPIKVGGDGSPYRSYLYAADLVVWLLTCLTEGKDGEAYNVGSDVSIDIEELANTVGTINISKPVLVEIARQKLDGAAKEHYVPSVEKAKNELNLSVFTPLEESIKKMIRFYSN
jgi:nucleoside-diphosphate-sugar epimerase